MQRRRLLAGAAGALGALAGCTDVGGRSLENRPPENAVVDGIRIAVGQANTVGIELSAARANAEDPSGVRIDRPALGSRLATARHALDDAEGREPASAYRGAIDTARSYVETVAGMVAVTATLTAVSDRLSVIEDLLENREFGAASDELEAIEPDLTAARSDGADAESTANGLAAGVLRDYGAQVQAVTDGAAELAGIAAAADEIGTGYRALLDGRERLETGRSAFDDGEFDRAETAMADAAARFESATGHFETARTAADGQFTGRIDRALCRSGALADAAEHFQAAVGAARDGRLSRARQERDAGEADLDAAEAC